MSEVTKLGTPTSIQELQDLIKQFSGETSFGFRNQPIQTLYKVKYGDGVECVVFQQEVDTPNVVFVGGRGNDKMHRMKEALTAMDFAAGVIMPVITPSIEQLDEIRVALIDVPMPKSIPVPLEIISFDEALGESKSVDYLVGTKPSFPTKKNWKRKLKKNKT